MNAATKGAEWATWWFEKPPTSWEYKTVALFTIDLNLRIENLQRNSKRKQYCREFRKGAEVIKKLREEEFVTFNFKQVTHSWNLPIDAASFV
jgi:hypothetical protein